MKTATLPAREHAVATAPTPWGFAARFDSEASLKEAAEKAYLAGYRWLDAYSPVPVEGLAEKLGRRPKTTMPLIVLLGGIIGGTSGYFMQWYSMTIDYPYNIGGRPFHSWPMFIPVTFELTVLCAALAGVFGMLFLNGLPRFHHPIFGAPGIERSTIDQYFLSIEAADPKWNLEETRRFLAEELRASEIVEVPR